jgi:Cdc6-like AAA superfamily ATPase/tetratricopeptide (TPR) repeat protein
VDQLEMQQMRDLVAEELRQLDTSFQPTAESAQSRYTGYHEAAAVLSNYELGRLKSTSQSPERDGIERLLADSCITYDAQHRQRWTLLNEVRPAVLKQLGSRQALIHALEVSPERPDDTLQEMLEAYLRGNAPPVPSQTVEQLTCTLQIISWFKGVEALARELPSETQVRTRIEMAHLLEPFEKLVGQHFRGRVAELDQLREYVGVLPPDAPQGLFAKLKKSVRNFRSLDEKPPLMIYGPGGMGKSTLVAKFILEHATLPQERRFPFAYMDFDRPGLLAEEPATLLIEAAKQLGIQYPDVQEYCDRVRRSWQKELAKFISRPGKSKRHTASPNKKLLRRSMQKFLHDFSNLLETMGLRGEPLLLVLDTFEEVQCRSRASVEELWRFLEEFQARVPRLRTVLSGRALLGGHATESLRLKNLDEAAAQGFLEAHGVGPQSLVKAIIQTTKGNPLSLHLAVKVFRKEGAASEDFFRHLTKERIQGELYERVLSHIEDENVAQLAHPGFILRRLTPELVLHVLAEPCRVTVKNLKQARKLFDDLSKEITLVTLADDGALRHQPEVRMVMIDLLRADESKAEQVERIQTEAIKYYEQFSDPVSRAEEIYHLLSLNQAHDVVARRWVEGVQEYLYSAVEELNAQAQVFLAPRLGIIVDDSALERAPQEDWERAVEYLVADALQVNDDEKALKILGQREARLPGSHLYLLEAEICEGLGELRKAQAVAESALKSMPESPESNSLTLDLLLLHARVARIRGEFTAARQSLQQARSIAVPPLGLVQLLMIELEQSRLNRFSEPDIRRVEKVVEIFAMIPDDDLADQHNLVRRVVSDFGKSDERTLLRGMRLLGLDHATLTQKRALARAIAEWDLRASGELNAESGILARSAGVPVRGELVDAWTNFMQSASSESIVKAVSSLLGTHDTPAPVHAALADIFQLPETFEPLRADPTDGGASPPTKSGDESAAAENYSEPKPPRPRRELTLTGAQLQKLHYALLNAFPNRYALESLLRFRLNYDLNTIALTDRLENTVSLLVEHAAREGWVGALVAAALESNPGNNRLSDFAREAGLAPSTRDEPGNLERLLKTTGSSMNMNVWRARMAEIESRVCRVEDSSGRGLGTAFLIGPDLLLTAFHVVEGAVNGHDDPTHFNFHFDHNALHSDADSGTIYRLVPNDWLVDYSGYEPRMSLAERKGGATNLLDYALLRLAGVPGQEPVGGERAEPGAPPRGWITVQSAPRLPEKGQSIFIVHHVHGDRLRLEIGTIIAADEDGTSIYYDAETGPGSSGAPCFNIGWELIAIHHSLRAESSQAGAPHRSVGTQVAALLPLLAKRGRGTLPAVNLFAAPLLRGGRPFFNRLTLRQHLRLLASPEGPRVLLVNGPRGSGKTYSCEFIFHVLTSSPGNRYVYVDFSQFNHFHPSMFALAEEIAYQMRRPPGSMPVLSAEQMERSVNQLCNLITAEVNKGITNWWLIFDEVQDVKLAPEILDFIYELMFRSQSVARRLRLILLSFDDALPPGLEAGVLREKIGPVQRDDLVEFFRELFISAGWLDRMEKISEIVAQLWSDSERRLADEPDKEAKRLMFLNSAAYSLVRELFPPDEPS